MTGEGIGDAPALVRAEVGAAMGITGTEESKKAADMILLDDNFATIVSAAQEGRTVSDNLRKFLRFIVAGNIGKALTLCLAPFLSGAIPLLPLQVLWLNLVTDSLLGVGLGVERAESNTMKGSPTEIVFNRQTIFVGALIGALALGLGALYFFTGRAQWQTMIFTSLAFMQVFQALASRSSKDSLFKIRFLSNPLLAALALTAVALQLAILYIPFLSGFFNVVPLCGCDLSIAAGAGVVVFAVIELTKRMGRGE